MATSTLQDVSPDGTPAQNTLIYQGAKAVVEATFKAYASMANNQTLVAYENSSGLPVAVTFEIEKSASGWTPTGGAVLVVDCTGVSTRLGVLQTYAAFLNARPNRAYVWAVNGAQDGLVGVAIYTGTEWNNPTSGTITTANPMTAYGSGAYEEEKWETFLVYEPATAATSYDLTFNPATCKKIRITITNIGAAAADDSFDLQAEGVAGEYSNGALCVAGSATALNAATTCKVGYTKLWGSIPNFVQINLDRIPGSTAYFVQSTNASKQGSVVWSLQACGVTKAVSTYMRIIGTQQFLRVGCRIVAERICG